MLVEVNEPPRNGDQFIMTWFFNGQPWCDTYRYNNGVLEYYLESDNEGNHVDSFVKADRAWTRDNIQYFCFTEDSLKSKIQSIVKLAEEWSDDQENGMTPHQVCLAAMKDIRRLVS